MSSKASFAIFGARSALTALCCFLAAALAGSYNQKSAEHHDRTTLASILGAFEDFNARITQSSVALQQLCTKLSSEDFNNHPLIADQFQQFAKDPAISSIYLVLDEQPTGNLLSLRQLSKDGITSLNEPTISIEDPNELSSIISRLGAYARPFLLLEPPVRFAQIKKPGEVLVVVPLSLAFREAEEAALPVRQDYLVLTVDPRSGLDQALKNGSIQGYSIEIMPDKTAHSSVVARIGTASLGSRNITSWEDAQLLNIPIKMHLGIASSYTPAIPKHITILMIVGVVLLTTLIEVLEYKRRSYFHKEASANNNLLLAQLKRREREIEMILGAAPFGIILFNRAGKARALNAAAKKTLGVASSPDINFDWMEHLNAAERPRIKSEWETLAKDPQATKMSFLLTNNSQIQLHSLHLHPLENDSDFYGFVGFLEAQALTEHATERQSQSSQEVEILPLLQDAIDLLKDKTNRHDLRFAIEVADNAPRTLPFQRNSVMNLLCDLLLNADAQKLEGKWKIFYGIYRSKSRPYVSVRVRGKELARTYLNDKDFVHMTRNRKPNSAVSALVVGNHSESRDKVRDLLRESGIDCCFAHSSNEVPVLLQKEGVSFIIVSDNLSNEMLNQVQQLAGSTKSATPILVATEGRLSSESSLHGILTFDLNSTVKEFEEVLERMQSARPPPGEG